MGLLLAKCMQCGSRPSEDNHLVRVISYGKRHDQIFCTECFVNLRMVYINKINLEKYCHYINNKDDRN